MADRNNSPAWICKTLKISRSTLYRYAKARASAPLPASGHMLEVAEDGRMLLNLNREGEVGVYPARANFRPQVGDMIDLDERNQEVRSSLDIENGKTK